jgi:hypothetical protein
VTTKVSFYPDFNRFRLSVSMGVLPENVRLTDWVLCGLTSVSGMFAPSGPANVTVAVTKSLVV